MSTEREQLETRLAVATEYVPIQQLTLDELCRIIPVIEGAWERLRVPQRGGNVITFAACQRRRAARGRAR